MTKNLKALAIIFSVVLNIVFIGSHLRHAIPQRQGWRQGESCAIVGQLNLSSEQLTRFTRLRDSFHAFIKEQSARIKTRQLEFIDLIAQQKPNRRQLEAKQAEIWALQREMQSMVIKHLLAENKIFTPRQRRIFFSIIRQRIENSDARPGWIPRRQTQAAAGSRP
ncbi:Spy/CpxP family protein refolding chaperone [Desulfobacterota bacterium M19]